MVDGTRKAAPLLNHMVKVIRHNDVTSFAAAANVRELRVRAIPACDKIQAIEVVVECPSVGLTSGS